MKIAILSHFGTFNPWYALHVGWIERARILKLHGQDFDFLVNKNCRSLDVFPHAKAVLDTISTKQHFADRVAFFERQYMDLLKPYDAILTADMVFQRKGNFLAHNQAMRNAACALKARWFHWIHSSCAPRPGVIHYPDSLRYSVPPKSTLVYLNASEIDLVKHQYGAADHQIATVFNPKDRRTFTANGDSEVAARVDQTVGFRGKDVRQVLPFCTTRMESKGVDVVCQIFAALKRRGLRVGLVLANANARKRQDDIARQKERNHGYGLVDGQDYCFTSDITDEFAAVPRGDIARLYAWANLFVYASYRETAGNALQEALVSNCLCVLSENVPCFREYAGQDALYFPATFHPAGIPPRFDPDGAPDRSVGPQTGSLRLVQYHPSPELYFDELARRICARLEKTDGIGWPNCSVDRFGYEWIWEHQLQPLLYTERMHEQAA